MSRATDRALELVQDAIEAIVAVEDMGFASCVDPKTLELLRDAKRQITEQQGATPRGRGR